MIPRLLRRLSRTWLLGLGNLALALALAYELAAPASVAPRPAAESRAVAAAAEPASPSFAMPPIRQYREVLARPLFNRGRRPEQAAEDGARPATSLRLIGIVIAPDSRLALLEYGNPPKLARVGVGQAIAGWTIADIGLEDVVVRQGETVAHVKPRDVPPADPGSVSAVATSLPAASTTDAAPAAAAPAAVSSRGSAAVDPPPDTSPPATPSPAASGVAPWPSESAPSAWGSLRRYLDQTRSDDPSRD